MAVEGSVKRQYGVIHLYSDSEVTNYIYSKHYVVKRRVKTVVGVNTGGTISHQSYTGGAVCLCDEQQIPLGVERGEE